MSYIRKGEPKNYTYLDPRWGHSLIIYSAENLMYLNELWSRKAIFHELSHAWHIMNWPEKYPPIFDSWKNAKNSQKFVGVRDIRVKRLKVHMREGTSLSISQSYRQCILSAVIIIHIIRLV
jgi:hypothetical protein